MSNNNRVNKRPNVQKSDDGFQVTYRGHVYRIKPMDDWTVEDLRLLSVAEDKPMSAVPLILSLLGDKQVATFRSRHDTAKDLGKFLEAFMRQMGAESATPLD